MNSLILKPLGMTVKINALSLIGGKKLYIFLTNPCYFSDCMFMCVCVCSCVAILCVRYFVCFGMSFTGSSVQLFSHV